MPTLTNGTVESESTDFVSPPSMTAATKLESFAMPHAHLIAEESQRTRAASDGDQRPAAAASAVPSVQAAKPKFCVVAVDEKQVAPLPRPGAAGSTFPAETPPVTVNSSLPAAAAAATATALNGVNGSRDDGPGTAVDRGIDAGPQPRHNGEGSSLAFRPASTADNGGGRTSLPPPTLRVPAAVAGDGLRANGGGGGGSPRPTSTVVVGATVIPAGASPTVAAADADSLVGVPDDQATVSSGVQHRIHYRKLREKANSAAIDSEPAGNGGAGTASSARMDRLTVPTAASHYNSLPAAGTGWNYPGLLPPVPTAHRNISTLSLTLLLRDQRRKNLAMLARLFASRQKEKDLLDGQQQYQELIAEAKKKKRCHGVTAMHFVVGTLFITLIAMVVTSIKVFAPQRNIYSSQPGFVFDKDSRLLTVHNSSGYPLLQIRAGVDLRGLPYNCSTADDLSSRRRCWKWSPSNVTLRVSVVNLSAELTCIGVTWVTTNVDPVLRDCITLGQLQWYGGSSSRSLPWSLSAASASAGDAGIGPWLYAPGTALGWLTSRSWISSSGALVAASGYTPLYVNVRGGGSPAFCLSSWYGYERGGARVLNYTACVASDVPTVHRRLVESQRAAAIWADDYAAAVDDLSPRPSDGDVASRSKATGSSFAASSTTPSVTPPLTSTLPAEVAPATAISGAHYENDEAFDQWALHDSLPGSFDGDVADAAAEEPRLLSDVSRGRPRWTSSVVMRDPVWHVRADPVIGNNTTAAEILLQTIMRYRFAVGTFLIRDSILTDVDDVTKTVERVVAAARRLNANVPSFGLTLSAFVSVRSELFHDLRYQGLWTRSARSALPVLVRDPAADASGSSAASRAGGISVASLLVNSSSDVARELAEQGVREIVSKAGIANNSSSIAMLYLKVAVAVADLDLDSYPPLMQERLLAYPHWFARLGNDLSRFVARRSAADSSVSADGKNSGRLDARSVAAAAASSSSPLVLVDGATTGLAGYTLPEPVRRGSLADIVTHLVAASTAGDPPASIGPFSALDVASSGGSSDADAKRRYVLWLQLASFAPVVQLDVTPWSYGDDVAEQAKRILAYRDAEIVPRLQRLYEAFRLSGEPVYKPLWWNDSVAAAAKGSKLGTEFFLDDLLVAPVLDQKSYRLIYFPTGFWLDQGQKLYIGPGTHNVTIDPSVPPCFVRKTTGIHEPGIYDPDGDASRRRR